MDDSLELRMVLVDPGGSVPGASTTAGPPAQPKPVAPVGAGAGQTVTVGGVKMTAADVAALTGKSSAFAEAVGGGGAPAEPAGQARRRAKVQGRDLFGEGYSSRGEADRSSMFVTAGFTSAGEIQERLPFQGLFDASEKGQSRGRGKSRGLFPADFSSRGEVKTPLFPEGYGSKGGIHGEDRGGGADWQAKLFGLAQQAASNPAGAARAAAAMLGPQGALVAAALTAALAIGKVISDRLVEGIQRAGRFAQAGGSLGVALAGNQNRAAYAGGLNVAAEVIEATPTPLRRETAAIARASAQVVDAFGKVTDAFIERGRQLARFSPELAAARATARLRELGSDIRESQELGPSLARLSDAEGQLAADVRELLLPIKKFIVENLARFLEAADTALRVIAAAVEPVLTAGKFAEQAYENFVNTVYPQVKVLFDLLGTIIGLISPKRGKAENFMDGFLKLGDRANVPNYRRDPPDALRRARDQRLNVPAFLGL